MKDSQHLAFWSAALVAVVALGWVLHDVLLPFVGGLALAYLLNPPADRLQRWGINRTLAALLMVIAIVLGLIALIMVVAPLLVEQGSSLIGRIPQYLKRMKEILVDQNFAVLNWLNI